MHSGPYNSDLQDNTRFEALHHAVAIANRHGLDEPTAETVARAEAFHAFLTAGTTNENQAADAG